LFRERGYDRVSIDELMGAAGLTRGGFYAHFPSKSELFLEILRERHPMLRKLALRDGPGADELWMQMLDIFRDYLDPAHLEIVSKGCALSALGGDATRGGPRARSAYDEAFTRIVAEMARGQNLAPDDPGLTSALVLAVGAVSVAAATSAKDRKKVILEAAFAQFLEIAQRCRKDRH
jgi:TetR/AcrR family transcriptional repressor of nem operon